MSIVQLRVVMAGLDPAIYVLVTGTGEAGNRVDARVKPAHDDLGLAPMQDTTTNSRFPGQPGALRERGLRSATRRPLYRWRERLVA